MPYTLKRINVGLDVYLKCIKISPIVLGHDMINVFGAKNEKQELQIALK
jgi:hypothetical protein